MPSFGLLGRRGAGGLTITTPMTSVESFAPEDAGEVQLGGNRGGDASDLELGDVAVGGSGGGGSAADGLAQCRVAAARVLGHMVAHAHGSSGVESLATASGVIRTLIHVLGTATSAAPPRALPHRIPPPTASPPAFNDERPTLPSLIGGEALSCRAPDNEMPAPAPRHPVLIAACAEALCCIVTAGGGAAALAEEVGQTPGALEALVATMLPPRPPSPTRQLIGCDALSWRPPANDKQPPPQPLSLAPSKSAAGASKSRRSGQRNGAAAAAALGALSEVPHTLYSNYKSIKTETQKL